MKNTDNEQILVPYGVLQCNKQKLAIQVIILQLICHKYSLTKTNSSSNIVDEM